MLQEEAEGEMTHLLDHYLGADYTRHQCTVHIQQPATTQKANYDHLKGNHVSNHSM